MSRQEHRIHATLSPMMYTREELDRWLRSDRLCVALNATSLTAAERDVYLSLVRNEVMRVFQFRVDARNYFGDSVSLFPCYFVISTINTDELLRLHEANAYIDSFRIYVAYCLSAEGSERRDARPQDPVRPRYLDLQN